MATSFLVHWLAMNAISYASPAPRSQSLVGLGLGVLAATLVSIGAVPAAAVTIEVDSLADNVTAGDGACTLREAANNMNEQESLVLAQLNGGADTTDGDCPLGDGDNDTVVLPAGTIELAIACGASFVSCPGTSNNTVGAITFSVPVKVVGQGKASTTIDAAQLDRALSFIAPVPAAVSVQDLSVINGKRDSGGGGIVSYGALSLSDVSVRGCLATSSGGGVWSSGNLNVVRSEFIDNETGSTTGHFGGGAIYCTAVLSVASSLFVNNRAPSRNAGAINAVEITIADSSFLQNSAAFNGGAVQAFGTQTLPTCTGVPLDPIPRPGDLLVTGSLFSENTAGSGGAISVNGHAVIGNSTLAGNSASSSGSALRVTERPAFSSTIPMCWNDSPASAGSLELLSATIVGQTGAAATAIYADSSATLTFANTIVSENATNQCADDGSVGYVTSGSNLHSDATCLPITATGDQTNVTLADLNLSALGDHGGPTETRLPMAPSAALDAGNDSACSAAPISSVDQRGFTRPDGSSCDVGAVEARRVALTVERTGSGGVASNVVGESGTGIACGSTCSEVYWEAGTVQLTATADTGHTFTGWGGACAAAGTTATCDLTLTGALSATATFAKLGCIDSAATNYDATAGADDGSCVYATGDGGTDGGMDPMGSGGCGCRVTAPRSTPPWPLLLGLVALAPILRRRRTRQARPRR